MKTFELRLIPYELHAAIKAAAFREGVSMNKWILRALTEKIEQQRPTPVFRAVEIFPAK